MRDRRPLLSERGPRRGDLAPGRFELRLSFAALFGERHQSRDWGRLLDRCGCQSGQQCTDIEPFLDVHQRVDGRFLQSGISDADPAHRRRWKR